MTNPLKGLMLAYTPSRSSSSIANGAPSWKVLIGYFSNSIRNRAADTNILLESRLEEWESKVLPWELEMIPDDVDVDDDSEGEGE